MNKSKSIFVTAIMAIMLAAIIVGLRAIQYKAFTVLIGLLGVYGYVCAAVHFCRWLEQEAPLMPAHAEKTVQGEPVEKGGPTEFVPTPEYYGTYEQIIREMEETA